MFSDEFAQTGDGPLGYYFMNFEGEYLSYINNPNLEGINRDGITMKGAFSLSWSDAQGQFAIAYHDSTFEGYKIAVTDLTGSYYREYTSGAFIDDHPRWGPEGKTILFDRIALFDHTFTDYRLMVLDMETGAVREFAKPETYGAVALWLPDY